MSGKLNDSRLIDFVDTDGVTYEFGGDVTGLEGGRRGVGILTYTVDEVERVDSRHDQLAFGLRTRQTSDATLVHITSDNSNDYIRLELVSLQLFYLLVLTLYFITSARRYCDHVSLLVGWLVGLFVRSLCPIHTADADATRQNSFVSSAVCIGLYACCDCSKYTRMKLGTDVQHLCQISQSTFERSNSE